MFCCRRIHTLKRKLRSLWYSNESYINHSNQIIPLNDNFPEFNWETIVPAKTIVMECIQFTTAEIDIIKYKIWNAGDRYTNLTDEERRSIIQKPCKQPWLWIGSGDTNMTEKMKPYILIKNHITLTLLNKKFPDIKSWVFMNSSLDIVDFPIDGITIE